MLLDSDVSIWVWVWREQGRKWADGPTIQKQIAIASPPAHLPSAPPRSSECGVSRSASLLNTGLVWGVGVGVGGK